MLKIVFAGTPDFAAAHLKYLLEHTDHDIIAVYSQPDRPAGRGKKLKPSPVKAVAIEHDIPVYQPQSLKNAEAQQELADLGADLMIVVAYGLILPKAVLETPRLGCINVHASILPRWRGAAPIQRAIESGDEQTGVTIMQMDEGLDTGDMLVKAYCQIEADETGGSLHDKLISVGAPALKAAVLQLANNEARPEPQQDKLSCYASKIEKHESLINWQLPADSIEKKVRAFNPFPVCYSELKGERIKIWAATVASHQTGKQAGEILSVDKQAITVACGKGSLAIHTIQLPGKKAMSITELLNGRPDYLQTGMCFDQPVNEHHG